MSGNNGKHQGEKLKNLCAKLACLVLALSASVAFAEPYPATHRNRTAVILVASPDTPPEIRSRFPAVEEAQKYFFDKKVKKYFRDISYGKLDFDGRVFGYYTLPSPLFVDSWIMHFFVDATERLDFQLQGYTADDFDTFAFVFFHHELEMEGSSTVGSATIMVNGENFKQRNALYVGVWINGDNSTYDRDHVFKVRYGNGTGDIETGSHPSGFKYNQVVFMHEILHQITGRRILSHANSSTNNGKPDYGAPDTSQPADFRDLDYGNGFDIMGYGRLAYSLNAGYRKLCGWLDTANSLTLAEPGTYQATIYPINRTGRNVAVEVRLNNLATHTADFQGYYMEVREPDRWDAALVSRHLLQNTRGVMVNKMSGYRTLLLDMSPSTNFVDDEEKHHVDYTDMALLPGMTYENEHIRISKVQAVPEGAFSMEIVVK